MRKLIMVVAVIAVLSAGIVGCGKSEEPSATEKAQQEAEELMPSEEEQQEAKEEGEETKEKMEEEAKEYEGSLTK